MSIGLPEVLKDIILGYLPDHESRLLPWIDRSKIEICNLSGNPAAIWVLIKHQDKIDWYWLSTNTAAIDLLKANPDKINWYWLSLNPAAIDLLKANPDKIYWDCLSTNTAAIDLLKANPDKINWYWLALNPAAIDLLKDNPEKIDWYRLSENPAAIDLLKENPEKINWTNLSQNPAAIDLLKANPEKIDWEYLPNNPHGFNLLKENLEKINWIWLSVDNPDAFDLLKKYKSPDIDIPRFVRMNDLLVHNRKKIDNYYPYINPRVCHSVYSHIDINMLDKNPGNMTCNRIAANPAAIKILEMNIHKLDRFGWHLLHRNSEIFRKVPKVEIRRRL